MKKTDKIKLRTGAGIFRNGKIYSTPKLLTKFEEEDRVFLWHSDDLDDYITFMKNQKKKTAYLREFIRDNDLDMEDLKELNIFIKIWKDDKEFYRLII